MIIFKPVGRDECIELLLQCFDRLPLTAKQIAAADVARKELTLARASGRQARLSFRDAALLAMKDPECLAEALKPEMRPIESRTDLDQMMFCDLWAGVASMLWGRYEAAERYLNAGRRRAAALRERSLRKRAEGAAKPQDERDERKNRQEKRGEQAPAQEPAAALAGVIIFAAAAGRGICAEEQELFREALDCYLPQLEQPDDCELCRAYINYCIGMAQARIGDTGQALSSLSAAINLFLGKGERHRTARAMYESGNCYLMAGRYDDALACLEESLAILHDLEIRYDEVRVLSSLANAHMALGRYDDANASALVALTIYDALGQEEGTAFTLVTLATIHEKQENEELARGCYLKALDILDRAIELNPAVADRTLHLRATILYNIGRLYRYSDDPDTAKLILEQSLQLAQEAGDKQLQYKMHLLLSRLHEQSGDLSNALRHCRQYADIRAGFASEEAEREIARQQVQFEVARARREREIDRAEMARLQKELEVQDEDLRAGALDLLEKSRALEELMGIIKELQDNNKEEAPRSMRKKLKNMSTSINKSVAFDKDWDRFSSRFEKRYPGFNHWLLTLCPTLSPQELKICALIKAGHSTKDIAAIFHRSERTIETHRNNITRDRLNLPSGVRLVSFLTEFYSDPSIDDGAPAAASSSVE